MAKAANSTIPRRPLGKSGIEVSILGVGGYHLGAVEDQDTVTRMIHAALDAGINFFDNAWEYYDGESEARLGKALAGRRQEAVVMTKVCTHGRDKNIAMQMLDESLRRLQTDHLDVWQIHEVIYENDPQRIFRPNGAIEALAEAKKQGKVRLVGFTGHKLPSIHMRMLQSNFSFDTVQMPLNPFDATYRSFEQTVLPEANRRGTAVLGMKSLGGSGEMVKKGGVKVEDALRYAMSLPVATTISGMDSPEVLAQNLEILHSFTPMTADEMKALRDKCRPDAADGRMELFKSTMMYDGAIGREQHGFPSAEKLPA
ncbi:MAG TPA: aldo/keto reductase [Bryobacteraceae bacterium]|nr:aldo/keto reductase [Bryobacteraceae bacterium]